MNRKEIAKLFFNEISLAINHLQNQFPNTQFHLPDRVVIDGETFSWNDVFYESIDRVELLNENQATDQSNK